MPANSITLVLAEDHAIVREGIRQILQLASDIKIVGEAADGRTAVGLVAQTHPDVVLMDIGMPNLNGVEATRQILKSFPETKIIMLTGHFDDGYVREATEAGAKGFLLKNCSCANEVCQAVRDVQKGKTVFSPAITKRFDRLHPSMPDHGSILKTKANPLTPREMEVLQLIAEGSANKESAVRLGVGVKTIEKHRSHLMEKLNIHDTAGLTRYAIRRGIIESHVLSSTAFG